MIRTPLSALKGATHRDRIADLYWRSGWHNAASRGRAVNLAAYYVEHVAAEVASLREKLAAAERERDEHKEGRALASRDWLLAQKAASASQAEAAALRAGLKSAFGEMEAFANGPWNGVSLAVMEDVRALLAAPASTDALREFGVRVGEAAAFDAARNAVGAGPEAAAAARWVDVPAIVARVLAQPDAGQPEGEA